VAEVAEVAEVVGLDLFGFLFLPFVFVLGMGRYPAGCKAALHESFLLGFLLFALGVWSLEFGVRGFFFAFLFVEAP
jgi:hypothetical protein